jgi:hypothetical protein
MTTSASSLLDDRTPLGVTTTGRRRRTLRALRRRSDAKRYSSTHRQHDRGEGSDAYLDRTGLSSVDWLDGLTRQAQR